MDISFSIDKNSHQFGTDRRKNGVSEYGSGAEENGVLAGHHNAASVSCVISPWDMAAMARLSGLPGCPQEIDKHQDTQKFQDMN
jgi:hypothetical protein